MLPLKDLTTLALLSVDRFSDKLSVKNIARKSKKSSPTFFAFL
jgi:hypothetical protein